MNAEKIAALLARGAYIYGPDVEDANSVLNACVNAFAECEVASADANEKALCVALLKAIEKYVIYDFTNYLDQDEQQRNAEARALIRALDYRFTHV
jgi:hypothetical protein